MFDMRIGGLSIDKSTGPLALCQLVDLSTNIQTSIAQIAPYHRYKGLSSIPNLARYRENILDTKQSYIYKHYVPDMGIWGYKGLADMKV